MVTPAVGAVSARPPATIRRSPPEMPYVVSASMLRVGWRGGRCAPAGPAPVTAAFGPVAMVLRRGIGRTVRCGRGHAIGHRDPYAIRTDAASGPFWSARFRHLE